MHLSVDSNLFKPFKMLKDSLIGVGIQGKHATLSFNIAVDVDEEHAIALALTKLTRTMSNIFANKYLHYEMDLCTDPIVLKGKAVWDSSLTMKSHPSIADDRWRAYTNHSSSDSRQTTFFTCPRCEHVEPCYLGAFQRVDLDRTQLCMSCKKYSPVHHWKCECGNLWRNCYQHRWCGKPAGVPLPSKHKHSSNTGPPLNMGSLRVPKRRKIIPILSFEDLLAQDIYRATLKRKERDSERVLELGVIPATTQIKSSFLTADLKRRFQIAYKGDSDPSERAVA